MLSLKPPWRLENPIMEKTCQAYHKQTAPAENIEVLNNLKVTMDGKKLSPEVVSNGEEWWGPHQKTTTVLYRYKEYPALLIIIAKRGLRVAGLKRGTTFRVFYKGERIGAIDGMDTSFMRL